MALDDKNRQKLIGSILLHGLLFPLLFPFVRTPTTSLPIMAGLPLQPALRCVFVNAPNNFLAYNTL